VLIRAWMKLLLTPACSLLVIVPRNSFSGVGAG
jgi:hypothetical protein